MTITGPGRDRLYTKLREILGTDDAGTLIEMLPPDRNDLATKSDIAQLDQRMDGLDQRMDGLDQRMDGLDQRMDGLDQRMGALEHLMEKFDGRLWDFHGALRAQTRVFATITVTAMLGIGSLSFAAAALL